MILKGNRVCQTNCAEHGSRCTCCSSGLSQRIQKPASTYTNRLHLKPTSNTPLDVNLQNLTPNSTNRHRFR